MNQSETPLILRHGRRRRAALGATLSGVPCLLLLSTGALKLATLDQFAESLSSWTMLNKQIAGVLVTAVPLVEFWIGIAWIFVLTRRVAALSASCVLICMAIAYAIQFRFAPPPQCGCWGILSAYFASQSSVTEIVIRNSGLALCGLASLFFLPSVERASRQTQQNESVGLKRSESTAFTLIEVLVVLIIVSLLAGFVVVGLSRTKNRAREVQNLVNLRSHASTWIAYSNDYKDVFPYFVVPEPGWIDVTHDDGSSDHIKYLQQRTEWPVLMSKSYYSGLSSLAPVFHPPWTISTYNSPCAFRVDPDHYTDKRMPFPSQLRAIFAHEVSIPSRKAFFSSDSIASENVRDFDSGSGWGGGYLYASFCDGSARKVDVTSIINWQTNGDFAPGQGPEWNDCPPYAKYTPLHHTRDGVRSPDVK